ncbi:tRNA methyltransferase 10 homolog A [Eupeodes corollae]|uniref:tRNA methyltransferase 10 homolog A n=1 Tax=Eupeodes corollae TaxID=290404 RepID=UPI00249189DA|nr:tRNA methyltransferase 10 homolog A [Eupeodes corollae]
MEMKEEQSSFGNPQPAPQPHSDQDPPDTAAVPETTTENTDPPAVVLSKRQLKKLKKKAQWEEKKKEKRQKEREKCKLKKQTAILEGKTLGPSRKELKRNKANKSSSTLSVAIDLDYDDLMIDKDVAKCVKQLLRIYTVNRRSRAPATLHFTGIKPDGRIHEVLKKNDGYEHWDVQWVYESYSKNFNTDQIVYLTSDSDEILKEIDPKKVYIIGGLVDHNHHKGLCFDRAKKLSLQTARLPLTEHVDMKTRTVLSTYHVFEILLRLSEGKSWADAILETLPVRKGAKLKEAEDKVVSSIVKKEEVENDDVIIEIAEYKVVSEIVKKNEVGNGDLLLENTTTVAKPIKDVSNQEMTE